MTARGRWLARVVLVAAIMAGPVAAVSLQPAAAVASSAGGTPSAAPPALKIAPLKYQAQLPLGQTKTGFVDVSNPLTTTVHVTSYAQAFRQTDAAGDLQFYSDPAVSAGITPQLASFDLPPRAAVRAYFQINPNAFGRAGVYGALFFQTTGTAPGKTHGSVITTNVRVGSLIILTIGNGGTTTGKIGSVHGPALDLGSGIGGSVSYDNTGRGSKALGFDPRLTVHTGWFSKAQTVGGSLVLPGSRRDISFFNRGSYFGLIPVTIHDGTGGGGTTERWVLACTGYWRWVVLVVIAALAGWWWKRRAAQPPKSK